MSTCPAAPTPNFICLGCGRASLLPLCHYCETGTSEPAVAEVKHVKTLLARRELLSLSGTAGQDFTQFTLLRSVDGLYFWCVPGIHDVRHRTSGEQAVCYFERDKNNRWQRRSFAAWDKTERGVAI